MRVAAVQAGSICFDTQASLKKLAQFAGEAAGGSAARVVYTHP